MSIRGSRGAPQTVTFMTQNTFECNYLCHAFNGTRLKNCRVILYALLQASAEFARDVEKVFVWSTKKPAEDWHASKSFCIRNIVLREFMFMVDYNENDYLYLPEPS
jgi:hypothetical protein